MGVGVVSKPIQNLLTKRNGSLIMRGIFFITIRKRTNRGEVREEDREAVVVVVAIDIKKIIKHIKVVEEVEAEETIIMATIAISKRSTLRMKINNNPKISISILKNITINHNIETNSCIPVIISITTIKAMIIDNQTTTKAIDRRAIIKKKEKTTIKIITTTTDSFDSDIIN